MKKHICFFIRNIHSYHFLDILFKCMVFVFKTIRCQNKPISSLQMLNAYLWAYFMQLFTWLHIMICYCCKWCVFILISYIFWFYYCPTFWYIARTRKFETKPLLFPENGNLSSDISIDNCSNCHEQKIFKLSQILSKTLI